SGWSPARASRGPGRWGRGERIGTGPVSGRPTSLLRRSTPRKAGIFMAQKVVLVADPGIDGAFAVALALLDPDIEVCGLAATAGNIDADQATKNVHILVEQFDPPRWPRLGAALPVEYELDGTRLHGPGGLGEIGRAHV